MWGGIRGGDVRQPLCDLRTPPRRNQPSDQQKHLAPHRPPRPAAARPIVLPPLVARRPRVLAQPAPATVPRVGQLPSPLVVPDLHGHRSISAPASRGGTSCRER